MTSTANPRMRVLLARPGYRRLWTARTVSQVGEVAQFTTARDGLRALAALPLLKALAVGQFLAALSAGATSALLVVLAKDRLGGGGRYGLLVGAIGVGAALGPLLVVRRIRDPRRPLLVFGPYSVRGLVDLVLSVVTTVPLAAGALLFYGLSTSTGTSRSAACCSPAYRRRCGVGRSPASTCCGRRAGC